MKYITLTEVLKVSIELEKAKRQTHEPQNCKVKELKTLEDRFVNASIKNQRYE